MRKPQTWATATDALRAWSASYRRDLWANNAQQVEVWCESDSIAGVLHEVTHRWGVRLLATKGYPSASFVYQEAQHANRDGRPLQVYYIGDHDPDGLAIDKALQTDLARHLVVPFDFIRVGVTWDQVDLYGLPGTEPKSDYGYPLAVEAEAMPPGTLRKTLNSWIEGHVSAEQLEEHEAVQAAERARLRSLLGGDAQ